MADIAAVSNYFVSLAEKENKGISPMKALKLAYIAHGFNLAIFDEPLFEEDVMAWRHGPVVAELYGKLKKYGSSNIEMLETDGKLSENEKDVMDAVWDGYGDKSAWTLSELTHMEGSPWYGLFNIGFEYDKIPNSMIKRYYKGILEERRNVASEA